MSRETLIFREGKTQKDKDSGSWARNMQNKQERASWNNRKSGGGEFPKHTCNGKKNRLNRKVRVKK